MGDPIQPPARTPCASCPYRVDAPSGLWDPGEYAKLPTYDLPTYAQPAGLFLCHDDGARVCAGWAGCHPVDDLLAVRLAAARGDMTPEGIDALYAYICPVPLHDSGAAAAAHGLADIDAPGPPARAAAARILRRRQRNEATP